jgi:hypothetical protein
MLSHGQRSLEVRRICLELNEPTRLKVTLPIDIGPANG